MKLSFDLASTRIERSSEVSCFRGAMLKVSIDGRPLGGADHLELLNYKSAHGGIQRALSELVGPHWDPQIAQLGITTEDVCVLFEGFIFEEPRYPPLAPQVVRKAYCLTRKHFTEPSADLWFVMTTSVSLVDDPLPRPSVTVLRAI